MVRVFLVLALLLAIAEGARTSADPLLAESFEGALSGWRLVLNRGAEGDLSGSEEAVLGARSIRIVPRRLAAPDDSELVTSVHLRSPELSRRAGVRYVLSAWMRSDARRLVRLRVAAPASRSRSADRPSRSAPPASASSTPSSGPPPTPTASCSWSSVTASGRSHERGTQPHPVWSPDGRSILYDSDETGHCQLYQVFLPE